MKQVSYDLKIFDLHIYMHDNPVAMCCANTSIVRTWCTVPLNPFYRLSQMVLVELPG